jgi:diguanylate cyclase (GGDEF)-like protein
MMCLVAAVVTTVSMVLLPGIPGAPSRVVGVAIPVMLYVFALMLLLARDVLLEILLVLAPVLGLGAVVGLDLVTRDASAGAQVFLCFPVLYAASQLPGRTAGMITALAVGCDALVVLALKPLTEALADVLFVGSTLLAVTQLLVAAMRRQESLVARLVHQAAVDPLTGLVTRRVLDDAVQRALDDSRPGAGVSLILVDVDHFKAINDTHGHPIGDDALTHLADVLTRNARPDTLISRLGGDEIAVLLPDCDYDVAMRRAAVFFDAVRSTPLVLASGGLLRLSVSVGVAHAPLHAETLRQLYSAADRALYQAKRGGRGRVGTPEPVAVLRS